MSRAFTEHERAVLLRLVGGASDEEVLRVQLDASEYGEPWFEGSQSFTIVPKGTSTRPSRDPEAVRTLGPRATVVKDGSKPESDSNIVGEVFLWLDGGRITDLEYWWVTDEMPNELPAVDQLIDGR